jgi:hypothetical protein
MAIIVYLESEGAFRKKFADLCPKHDKTWIRLFQDLHDAIISECSQINRTFQVTILMIPGYGRDAGGFRIKCSKANQKLERMLNEKLLQITEY